MKKLLLLIFLLNVGLFCFSQYSRTTLPNDLKKIAIKKAMPVDNSAVAEQARVTKHPAKSGRDINEEEIGQTIYDLQSNASTPYGRFNIFDDGTMDAVWTRGTGPTAYTDRGTGYNYFNGTSWGPEPTGRIESLRTGWPSIAPLGPNGEIVISHQSATAPMVINQRATKGTGAWTQSLFDGPSGHQCTWPRMVSSGTDHNKVHIFALTAPVANGGTAYLGQDGAILYSRSTDGGVTWDKTNVLIDGTGSSDYLAFGGDNYSWVEPRGENLAFIVSDNSNDLFVLKSADGGDSWQKVIIWEHPYPHWNGLTLTDTFYCPDGSAHGVFDNNGLLHIAFGVNRAKGEGTSSVWYPFVDGIAYWNENLPTWTGGTQQEQENCLNPDLLFEQGSLIGWMQDVNGNGQLDLVGNATSNLGLYYLSPSSMPQLAVDQDNMLYMLFSGVTETFDNGTQQYRHIWGRGSSDGGQTWGVFKDFTGDVLHAYDECVFPVIASKIDANVHSIYQADNEPGMALRGDADPPGDNYIRHLFVSKSEFELTPPIGFDVSGIVTYPKTPSVPLSNVNISLKDFGGTVVGTTTTDASGNYLFSNVINGDYTLVPTTTKAWGGVTAGDVLLYKKHIAGISSLSGIFLASGDVNASGSLTAGDVLLIKKRIAGIINSFTVGDWIFNNGPVTVSGSNVTHDFNGLVYGDANASYTPPTKGNIPAVIEKSTASFTIQSVTLQPGQISIPVMANDVQNMGAFQFTITYDPSKLAFNGVNNWYKGINEVTVGSQIPGQLTFVWAADEGGISIANDKLFDLQFTNLSNESSTIGWSDSPTMREYTNWNGNVYEASYVNGTTDVTTSIGNLENASVNIYPNPNDGKFNLLLDKNIQSVNIRIFNTMGTLVFQKQYTNDNHSFEINLSDLPKGIYLLNANGKDVNFVKQLVVK